MALTKQPHLCLEEGVADVHVAPRIDASDLLKVASQESVSTPCEGLESYSFTFKVALRVQEATPTVKCHPVEGLGRRYIFAKQDRFQVREANRWCSVSGLEATRFVETVRGEHTLHTIAEKFKFAVWIRNDGSLELRVKRIHVHLGVAEDLIVLEEIL